MHKNLTRFMAFLAVILLFTSPGQTMHNTQAAVATPGNQYWQAGHTLLGLNGAVRAIARNDGKLYVAGAFTTADGTFSDGIAVWDGTHWSSLSLQTDGFVSALAVDNNDNIVVGGSFSRIGGIVANNLARWTGTAWEKFLAEPNGTVNALRFDATNNDLYVGGNFINVGGNTLDLLHK